MEKSKQAHDTMRELRLMGEEREPISLRELQKIIGKGFMTGSAVFGYPTESRDFDYCVLSDRPDISFDHWVFNERKGFYVLADYHDTKFMSVYFRLKIKAGVVLVNVLFMKREEFYVWKQATRWMEDYVNSLEKPSEIWGNKEVRVAKFEEFKEKARDWDELDPEN